MENVSLIECPRDAMQGWKNFIPTEKKIEYINSLLQVGFDTIDFGSFVSHKAIPQMADTAEVLNGLELLKTKTKLLAIVANLQGAEKAVRYDQITYLGFPFSISPTFQQRNTNSTLEESLLRIEAIQQLCQQHKRILIVYMSMGFGNPYQDPYDSGVLLREVAEVVKKGVSIISLADTVGLATPEQITFAFETLLPEYPEQTFGVHLHVRNDNWEAKLNAAFNSGCKRFDGALKGLGGCPMAQDDLVGNMDTEMMINYFQKKDLPNDYDRNALKQSLVLANKIFI